MRLKDITLAVLNRRTSLHKNGYKETALCRLKRIVQSGCSFDEHVLHVRKFRNLGFCRRIAAQPIATTQMDQVTQQNASLVQQAAAASQSLEPQEQQLTEAVAFFQLHTGSSVEPRVGSGVSAARESWRMALRFSRERVRWQLATIVLGLFPI
jgi:hypothetical protein